MVRRRYIEGNKNAEFIGRQRIIKNVGRRKLKRLKFYSRKIIKKKKERKIINENIIICH